MADVILDPQGCESMEAGGSASVDRWLVSEGEHVDAGQVLATILLARQPLEVRSPHAGVVEQILVAAGERLAPGQVLARVIDF